jgi:hypothetical protein
LDREGLQKRFLLSTQVEDRQKRENSPMTQIANVASNRSPRGVLLESIQTMCVPYALQAVAHYNFATLIGDGSKSTAELARETGTQEGWVYRVLRFLTTQGIFVEVAPRLFSNTDVSTYLRNDVTGSLYHLARMMGSGYIRRTWAILEECMRTGKSAFEINYNTTFFDYLAEHPEDGAMFDAAMTDLSDTMNEVVATHYDFSSIHRLVDVGGGQGSLLAAILSHYPTINGALFDLPATIERVRASGANKQNCELVAGSFLESVPQGADAYILKLVLHNWADEQCRTILQNCRQAMQPSGVVLVCEWLVPPENNQGAITKGLDILIGLLLGGCERTVEDFRALFASAGLHLTRVIPTPSPCTILEAVIAE